MRIHCSAHDPFGITIWGLGDAGAGMAGGERAWSPIELSRMQGLETKCGCAFNYGGDALVSDCQNRLSELERRFG